MAGIMQLMTFWHMAIIPVVLNGIFGGFAVAASPTNYTLGYSFFEMTPENLKASGVAEWYGNWSVNARANEPGFTKYGEVTYFGMQFLGDGDYHCGIGYSGCNRWPKLGDILQMHSDDVELSRRVHFVIKMQNNVNLLFKLMEYGALSARISAADIVQLVVTTFTEQENAASKQGCQMLKAALQALVTMVIDASFTILSTEGMLAAKVVESVPAAMERAWSKFAVGSLIRFHNDQINQYTTGTLALDVCDQFGGNYQANNEGHAMRLRLMFDSMVSSFREALSRTTESFNQGAFNSQDPEAPSRLTVMMFSSPWINETVIHSVLQNPMVMEKHFKTQYMKYLIGTASRSSGCYIKCNTQENAQDVCHDTYKGINKSRFCPRPDKVCQFQCWANWRSGKELQYHGLDQISKNPFNIDIKKELLINYENFKREGNRFPTESFLSLSPLDAETPFSLPVCDSDAGYVYIGNIHRSGYYAKRMFPISCGDWRSNETHDFYRYAAMDQGSSKYKHGDLHHFYRKTIPKSLDRSITMPLDAFLAYCELGVSFPQHGSHLLDFHNVILHRNPHCDEIRRITKGMDHISANIEFCVGKQQQHLKDEDSSLDKDLMNLKGSRHKCDKFITMDLRFEDPVRYPQVSKQWKIFRHANEGRGGW